MKNATILICAISTLVGVVIAGPDQKPEPDSIRIFFGSCAKQDQSRQLWGDIAKQNPDLFLMIGDAVYCDSVEPLKLKKSLSELGADPGYQSLKQSCPILAVWDDHDYGLNDMGGEHPQKKMAKDVFLDFFKMKNDTLLRKRNGLYQSFHLPLGDSKGVKIVILDTRFNRGKLESLEIGGHRLYVPNSDEQSSMLGNQQWAWLESELSANDFSVLLLVSSIQVLPATHPGEKWANLPHERQRLLALLSEKVTTPKVILSGDQHLAEYSRKMVDREDLWEFTSSGLTHTRGDVPAINECRVGQPILKRNFGAVQIEWKGAATVSGIVYGDGGVKLAEREFSQADLGNTQPPPVK